MTRFIAWTLILALAAGCATVKIEPPQGKGPEQAAKDSEECSRLAAAAAETTDVGQALLDVAYLSVFAVLLGASEGAGLGGLSGGSHADGAWIGAAIGAGIGIIVGLVVGIKKGVERHRQYRQTYERCLAERGYSA